MKTKALIVALFAALLFMATPQVAFGQFRESAFKQNYATDKEASKDTTDYNKLSFKNLFRGLAGKSDNFIQTENGESILYQFAIK